MQQCIIGFNNPLPITVPSSIPKALGCLLAFFYLKDERAQPVKLMCCKFSLPSTLQQIWCVSLYLCPRPPSFSSPSSSSPNSLIYPPLLPYSFSSPSSSSSPPPLYNILSFLFLYSLSLLILLSSFPYSFSSNSLFSSFSFSPSSSPLLPPPLLFPLLILL